MIRAPVLRGLKEPGPFTSAFMPQTKRPEQIEELDGRIV